MRAKDLIKLLDDFIYGLTQEDKLAIPHEVMQSKGKRVYHFDDFIVTIKVATPTHILQSDVHLESPTEGFVEMMCGKRLYATKKGKFNPDHDFFGAPTNKATCVECLQAWRKT